MIKSTRFVLAAARTIRSLKDDRRGVSAVEFAMLLPVMVLLLFGTIEASDGVTINRKVASVASTLADLSTQSREISNAEMKNILDAAAAVVTPYPGDPLKMIVTGVNIDDKGNAKVAWSDARNATAYKKDASVTLPTGMATANTFLVMTEITYPYTPPIGYVMTGTFNLKSKFLLRPRVSEKVARIS